MFENGTILDNKYQIQTHLGTGGMGEVYRVLDLEQSQECALKILNTLVDQKVVHRRFHREFQVLNRFHHPRLVRTYTWGFAEDRPIRIKLRVEKRQTVKYHAVKWTVMNFTGVASHE